MHFYRKCWFDPYISFFVRLPVTDAWNCQSLYTAFSSNVGAWGMWACSLFLSFDTPSDTLEKCPYLTYYFPIVNSSYKESTKDKLCAWFYNILIEVFLLIIHFKKWHWWFFFKTVAIYSYSSYAVAFNCRNKGILPRLILSLFWLKLNLVLFERDFQIVFNDKYLIEIQIYVNDWQWMQTWSWFPALSLGHFIGAPHAILKIYRVYPYTIY